MNETSTMRIDNVTACGEYALRVSWVTGAVYDVDLRRLVFALKGLRPLRDVAAFAAVNVGEGGHSVCWQDDLDVGADRLWELSLEQNGHADAAEFLRWRWRHGLSLSATADALGLSRRTVAYYSAGEHDVSRTVLLACKGWEAERQRAG